jgi:hypothetical protein
MSVQDKRLRGSSDSTSTAITATMKKTCTILINGLPVAIIIASIYTRGATLHEVTQNVNIR